MIKIVTVVGARPQFIKAATLSRALSEVDGVKETLIHTGQHFDNYMSDVFFEELDLRKPDYNLGIGGGTHGQNTGRMIEKIEEVLVQENPDWVLVYGDTDSTLSGALAAVKLHIPLAHVEAGLRSYNRRMPEEINRVLTDHASDVLLAPTKQAMDNLTKENIPTNKVFNVGDVMYDATLHYMSKMRKPNHAYLTERLPFYLCTIHRAENTDDSFRLKAYIQMLNQVAETTHVVLPIHPRTQKALNKIQDLHLSTNISVLDPVGYLEMNWLLSNCSLVLTDSGGLQKEAFFHSKPCLTLREETEWVELVEMGWNYLIPPFASNIMANIDIALNSVKQESVFPYGDGRAAQKILTHLL